MCIQDLFEYKLFFLDKVCITPSHLEGGLLYPLTFKTGYLTPSPFQNRTNHPPSGFGGMFC